MDPIKFPKKDFTGKRLRPEGADVHDPRGLQKNIGQRNFGLTLLGVCPACAAKTCAERPGVVRESWAADPSECPRSHDRRLKNYQYQY